MYSTIMNLKCLLFFRFQLIPRWMDKTCLKSPSVKGSLTGEIYSYSFYDDLVHVESVNMSVAIIQDTLQEIFMAVNRYIFK